MDQLIESDQIVIKEAQDVEKSIKKVMGDESI